MCSLMNNVNRHHQAVRYSVSGGWNEGANTVSGVVQGKQEGFVATRASVTKLNCIVVDALISGTLMCLSSGIFHERFVSHVAVLL